MDDFIIKKIIPLLIITLFFSHSLGLAHEITSHNYVDRQEQSLLLSGGKLIIEDDIPLLYVNGSPYEMGYQHGFFLAEQVQQNIRAFLNDAGITLSELLDIWEVMQDYVPDEYINELHGLADGSGMTFEEVVAGYMVIVWSDLGCFGISAWGSATSNGSLIHARSFDFPLTLKDPDTGAYVHDNHVLIIRQPDNGYSSLIPSVAGAFHGGGGFNTQGMAVGMQVCWSKDQTYEGTPALFRVLQVLDHASTAEDALSFLTTNQTLGWNFIVSDPTPIGYAVETTGNYTYIGTHNNSIEDTPPFWSINHVVRRTNFFIDPTIAATQRDRYQPHGILGLIDLLLRGNIFFVVWMSYKVMSTDIEASWGDLTLNSTMNLLRQGYSGNTNILLKIIVFLAKGTSFNRAWHQWVALPETGEMVVCFAKGNTIAFDNPVHNFNLQELLT
jgi:predicted choloylglycine hydrolase